VLKNRQGETDQARGHQQLLIGPAQEKGIHYCSRPYVQLFTILIN
jgi:hypothetical protein